MNQIEVTPGVFLPENIYALVPSRIIGGEIREYEGFKAPKGVDSFAWAESCLNRFRICGIGPGYESDNCLLDYYDKDGNIIGEIALSKRAFEYVRSQWKFKRVS